MRAEVDILVNFPIDTSPKKKTHSALDRQTFANSHKGCGLPALTSRIVTGKDANPNEWPWLASIVSASIKDNQVFCSGLHMSEKTQLSESGAEESLR